MVEFLLLESSTIEWKSQPERDLVCFVNTCLAGRVILRVALPVPSRVYRSASPYPFCLEFHGNEFTLATEFQLQGEFKQGSPGGLQSMISIWYALVLTIPLEIRDCIIMVDSHNFFDHSPSLRIYSNIYSSRCTRSQVSQGSQGHRMNPLNLHLISKTFESKASHIRLKWF